MVIKDSYSEHVAISSSTFTLRILYGYNIVYTHFTITLAVHWNC